MACSAAVSIHAPAALFFSTQFPAKPTSSFPRFPAVFFGNSASSLSGLNLIASAPARSSSSSSATARATKANPTGEQKWTYEGSVTESLPNGMFRVRLDNEDLIIGYISGKIRKNFVRILPGDRVRVEVSRYDVSRGRIIYRLRNRDPSSD
ncbi:unnamed protein product [Linum tenue]|uniref:Translation initiation factor IF-1, chloroplastic n=1 Tax=Linum tenue TaxID=586396 RepID=A0AAV0M0S1_9ROSI|nr:unnamed protein product [Linum tenue]